jgi:predicted metal-dependent phosphoesterase TrpH
MSLTIDLHAHSLFSDGTLTPSELVQRAAKQSVDVLALTDHDETAGLAEARQTADQCGVVLVPGVEISASWRSQTIHVVGLNVDAGNSQLQQGLQQLRDMRIERARRINAKFIKLGAGDALADLVPVTGTEAVTRTHFGRWLVQTGVVKDMRQAFKRWLGRKGKAYFRGSWVPLEEAISWINAAGGQAVLAHPGRYRLSSHQMDTLLAAFKDAGGAAIEVACSAHDMGTRLKMARLAEANNLLASAGSDFHSPGAPHIELGRHINLPSRCRPIWETWPIMQRILTSESASIDGEGGLHIVQDGA